MLVACEAKDEAAYMEERFGPHRLRGSGCPARPRRPRSPGASCREHGALTLGVYSTKAEYQQTMVEVSCRAGVALSLNLTDGVVQPVGCLLRLLHGTGMNPAANANYTRLRLRRQPLP